MNDETDIDDIRRLIADRADRRTRPPATDRVDLATGWQLAQATEATVTEIDANGVTTTTETFAVSPLLLGIEPQEGTTHD